MQDLRRCLLPLPGPAAIKGALELVFVTQDIDLFVSTVIVVQRENMCNMCS